MIIKLGLGNVETKVGDSNSHHRATAHLEIDVHDPRPVLVINGTPGRWGLSTLNESTPFPGHLSLDFGQGWNLVNPNAVIAKANRVIANLTFIEVESRDLVEFDNLVQFS